MTRLNVCCALITLSSAHGPLLLAAKKACGQSNGLLYEFPGGKLEAGEDARLIPFLCELEKGRLPIPLEHESLGFFSSRSLPSLPWAPADLPILKEWLDRNAR